MSHLSFSLGGERKCKANTRYRGNYDPKRPDLVFEFRYRPIAMLQALGIIPPPKREAPPIIDLDDEDIQPPPKRSKTAHDGDSMESVQVRNN